MQARSGSAPTWGWGMRDRIVAVLLSTAMLASGLTVGARSAAAEEPLDQDYFVTEHDLQFILKQIQISEAHAAAVAQGPLDSSYSLLCDEEWVEREYDPLDHFPLGDEPLTCVPHARLPWGLRTVTGELNNLFEGRDQFGAGGNVFPRLVDEYSFRDAEERPEGAPGPAGATSYKNNGANTYVYDSGPRLISNLIADQSTDNPAAVAVAERIDGSIVEPGSGEALETWTRLEEDDEDLVFDGPWLPWTEDNRSDGASTYAEEGATLTFEASDGFRWIGSTGPTRGIAVVFVDGEQVAEVDQYAAEWTYNTVIHEIDDLAGGPHEIKIVHTAEKNDLASYAHTEIDAIELLERTAGGTGNIFIPDVAPDEGLSAPFTGWFTLFGQFFDHGLDLIEKGGNGTVVVPLRPDDPLYDASSNSNFIMVTRATKHGDGYLNRTTPFVDQNQTYTSHPSHQVFLREYEWDTNASDPNRRPVPTGHLLDAPEGGLATWADVKAHVAEYLGIRLDDADVHEVPLLVTDPYGRFVPGANGLPQLVTNAAGDTVSGNLANPVATNGLGAGHAFLDDIAHAANPGQRETRGPNAGQVIPHDAALLAAHFVTGDGRGNENIGLTAVHHIFHSEHNRVADHVDEVLGGLDQNSKLVKEFRKDGVWDYGERLFQAARYVTEMQYQHLVFEEFARTISPEIDVQPLNETAYHDDLDASISAEFANVVYRFGHSMLTETVDRVRPDTGELEEMELFDAFLNPGEFTGNGAWDADAGAAAVIVGMTRQTGNGIDEFVTPVLRNQLLGLPLDLAAINLARARETGMPTLQEARRHFYNETLDANLKPYGNWREFMLAMKHRESIANFVAAYGIHASLDRSTMTVDELRDAAAVLVDDSNFMGAAAATTGVDDIDFWMGGLAEDLSVFGGFLGPTFNYVFERQLESLQNGDRFYYLTRNQGLNLFHQLENSSFAELILRNTDAELLHANVFASPDHVFDLRPGGNVDGLLVNGNEYRFDGDEHVVMHGTGGADIMIGGKGDDSIWGHDGDDRIQGGQGNDTLHGGRGDDIIQDEFGDDTIHGGFGNDAINGGAGVDLIFGGPGKDFILHGSGVGSSSFGGAGDDFILGGSDGDVVAGSEGDDWLEGGPGHDLVQGDNTLTFQNDPYGGHDVLFGGPGNDDHDAEGGDDIMLNNGIDRHAGMLGFDWVTHQHDPNPGRSDLDISIYQPFDVTLMRSRYFSIEGLSGWKQSDVLRGASTRGDQPFKDGSFNELTQEHLDRIEGLRDLLGGGADPRYAARFMTPNESNNIILGGAGSDVIEGRAGDDFIDGSSWLEVGLEWRKSDGSVERGKDMQHFAARVFDGLINPGDLHIYREIVEVDEPDVCNTAVYSDVFAKYTVRNNGDGTWTVDHTGGPEDDDLGDDVIGGDGNDIVRNIGRLRFANAIYVIDRDACTNAAASGTVAYSTGTPRVGQPITATATIEDADGFDAADLHYEWQADVDGVWTTLSNDEHGDGANTFTPTEELVGQYLRVVVTFIDAAGVLESVELAQADAAVAGVDTGPVATVPGQPTNVTATRQGMGGSRNVNASWAAPASNGGAPITGYVVEAVPNTGNVTTQTVNGTSASFSGLPTACSYQVRVRAVNSAGQGEWSALSAPVVLSTSGGCSGQGGGPGGGQGGGGGGGGGGQGGGSGAVVFTDVAGTEHEGDILRLVDAAITEGFADGTFRPGVSVTRGQMATFLAKALDLPIDDGIRRSSFSDAGGTTHAAAIEAIAKAGITEGYRDGTFRPGDKVSRGQMATFLTRALELPAEDTRQFSDTAGNEHEAAINALRKAEVTLGYPDGTFRPQGTVTRGQMAAFLARGFGL